MKELILDIEGSKLPVIHPWQHGSYLSSVGVIDWHDKFNCFLFNHKTINPTQQEQCYKLAALQAQVDDCDIIVCHNAKFDISWIRYIGVNVDNKKIWCTQVADYLINGQDTRLNFSLDSCSERNGGEAKHDMMKECWDSGMDTYDIPLSIHIPYLEQDCRVTKALYEKQKELVKKLNIEKIVSLNMELCKMLSEMELTGISFDLNGAKKYVEEYGANLARIDKRIFAICKAEFNVDSASQLGPRMFGGTIKRKIDEFVCKRRKNGTFRIYTKKSDYYEPVKGLGFIADTSMLTKTGKYSTGKDILSRVRATTPEQKELLALLIERSNAAKVYSTLTSKDGDELGGLIGKVGIDGRIHPSFNQTSTRTGRLSSSNPNGQNLPRGNTSPLKKLFVADEGRVIINGDLSQIEWRTDAGMSRDPIMMQEIIDGVDIHTDVGIKHFGGKLDDPKFKSEYRQPAKTFNFRMIYDGKAGSFFRDQNMPNFTLAKWKGIVKAFWEKYNVLRTWVLNNERMVQKTKGWLRQPSGRLLNFKYYTEDSHEYKRGFSLNEICNYPIQSISADMMHVAMLYIYHACKKHELDVRFLLQVHDSLVVEATYAHAAQVADIMMKVFTNLRDIFNKYYNYDIAVPLTGEVSFGKSYGSMVYDYDEKNFSIEKFNKDLDVLLNQ